MGNFWSNDKFQTMAVTDTSFHGGDIQQKSRNRNNSQYLWTIDAYEGGFGLICPKLMERYY
jgi:hypothetical protein